MNIIDDIIKKAKNQKVRIVLPEYMDNRVMKAASIVLRQNICDIIIIGDKKKLAYIDDYILNNAEIINPESSILTDKIINYLFELRKDKGMSYDEASNLIYNDYMYFACMLVKLGYADGVVSGACHSSANTIRPALQIIKNKSNSELVSAFFLMDIPNCKYGKDGIFIFADAGLNQNPTSLELATIAKDSANSFYLLTEETPKIAMLSHSTKGSAKHPDIDKIVESVTIAHKKYPELILDGELQLDAAIIPEVARLKCPNNILKGEANVLIFPDLDAANIGYKLVERLANAKAYGPICQGLNAPINDLSRGCDIDDIVGVIAITSIQAQKK